ncbi:Guanine nucleotide-binding protein-like 3 -like protein, partial [Trichinella zimbabwensis]
LFVLFISLYSISNCANITMAKLILKKKSKRMTCRRKFKILSKIREHHRKLRKEERKKKKEMKNLPKSLKFKPLIHIPNSCPFKEEILNEVKQNKLKMEERKKAEEEEQKKNNLETIVHEAELKQLKFQNSELAALKNLEENILKNKVKGFEDFKDDLKRVIKRADVILEVLDARDPLGCRSSHVENMVLEKGKRLVLVLNKIDLIPKENIKKWLTYLRKEFPAIAIKSSTQKPSSKLGWVNGPLINTSKSVGGDFLMHILANYCRNKDLKTSIKVGVVGYPNVGKSSIINSLKRKAICRVGAQPGITKNIQEIALDKNITLIDSPGVVLAKKASFDHAELALKNVVRIETVQDVFTPVEAILRRCSREKLMLLYNLPKFQSSDEFLSLLARKMGRLKKGGIPNLKMAARKMLFDWNRGKIRYYSEPPVREDENDYVQSEVVTEMLKEFDIDALTDQENIVLNSFPENSFVDAILSASNNNNSNMLKNNNSEVPMETDTVVDDVSDIIKAKQKRKRPLAKDDGPALTAAERAIEGNCQKSREQRMLLKKKKKSRRRLENQCNKLANTMEAAMNFDSNSNDEYKFEDSELNEEVA